MVMDIQEFMGHKITPERAKSMVTVLATLDQILIAANQPPVAVSVLFTHLEEFGAWDPTIGEAVCYGCVVTEKQTIIPTPK
jgi:hypothetical protein